MAKTTRRIKNLKAKGSRNERRSRDLLKRQGYPYVVKAGGSLGPFDLVGIGCGHIVLVQVKTNRGVSPKEKAELQEAASKLGSFADVLVHRWEDGETYPYLERIF